MEILKLNPSKSPFDPPVGRAGKGDLEIIKKTAEVIKAGGLVVFPSDTVYGLLVDPTNVKAVNMLLQFKNRWTGKAVSIAVADKKMAEIYVKLSETGENVYQNLLPGPFTVISQSNHKVVKGIEAENGTLGIRIPDYQPIIDLVKILNKPITVTSANLTGRTPHYSIDSFLKTLSLRKKGMIDLIVDGGKLPKNKPSTVIDATDPELKVYRRGDLITGSFETLISKSEKETEKIAEFLVKKSITHKTHPSIQKPSALQSRTAPLDKGALKPIVFLLSGELGIGKTVFSRSVGKVLGVEDKITSPTFVIYNEYEIPLDPPLTRGKLTESFPNKFLHFDLYRISGDYELKEIDFFNLFNKNTIACIEWPENMGEENLKKLKEICDCRTINFEYLDAETRQIKYKL